MSLHYDFLLHYLTLTNTLQHWLFFSFFFLLVTVSIIAPPVHSTETSYTMFVVPVLLYFLSVLLLLFLGQVWFSSILTTYPENTYVFQSMFQHYFGNILVILSVLITFFSWWFLSERFIFKTSFLVIYLTIFFFCTFMMVSTAHLAVMFIFFEFIFFPSSFFVYSLSYSKKAEKTIEYLVIWNLIGAMIAFVGFGYLFYCTGTVQLSTLFTQRFSLAETTTLFFLFFFGFGVKIPLWPFYYWLTKVHVEAPTGFSMFLSGFLVKTAFFCFSQVFYLLYFKAGFNIAVSLILWGIADASSRMWSILDIKRLIALATVQEMNMIMLFLFLLSNTNYTILNSFLLIHGLLSVFFFFLVDVVYKQTQTRNLSLLGGLNLFSFKFSLFVWISILIYRGFPIFSKFFVEWELMGALLQNFLSFGFLFILFCSLAGTGSFFKHWASVLYSSPDLINFKNIFNTKDFTIGSTCITLLFSISFLFFYL